MSTLRFLSLCAVATLAGCWLTNAEITAKYPDPVDTSDTGTGVDADSEPSE